MKERPSIEKIVTENAARVKRKLEMLEVLLFFQSCFFSLCLIPHTLNQLKNKSQMTYAEVRSELIKMAEGTKASREWFISANAEASSKLMAKVATASCTPSEVADLLIQGADCAGHVDLVGRSALHWAVQMDNVVVASMLMDFGAAADLADYTRTLPIHVAASTSFSGTLAALLLLSGRETGILVAQNCSGWTPLHVASFTGNAAALRLLLALPGDDLGLGDIDGVTALHAAAGNGQLEAVRLLVSRGAPVNARAASGDTPLHFAARMGHGAIIVALIKVFFFFLLCTLVRQQHSHHQAGADRSQKNGDGIMCQGMAGFSKWAGMAERELVACSPTDVDLPLRLEIGPAVVRLFFSLGGVLVLSLTQLLLFFSFVTARGASSSLYRGAKGGGGGGGLDGALLAAHVAAATGAALRGGVSQRLWRERELRPHLGFSERQLRRLLPASGRRQGRAGGRFGGGRQRRRSPRLCGDHGRAALGRAVLRRLRARPVRSGARSQQQDLYPRAQPVRHQHGQGRRRRAFQGNKERLLNDDGETLLNATLNRWWSRRASARLWRR